MGATLSQSLGQDNSPKPNPAGETKPDTPASDEPTEEQQAELKHIDKMEYPTTLQILKDPPVDWVVLKTGKVIVCEPVAPRPGTLESLAQALKDASKKGIPPGKEGEEERRRRNGLNYLNLTLLQGEQKEYKVHTKYVKEIIYFEDLVLRRVDQLIEANETFEAYDLLVLVQARAAGWPGMIPREEKLLQAEVNQRLKEQNLEQALVLLEEIHERNPNFGGLKLQLGNVVDTVIGNAVSVKDYRKARHFLNRLKRREPTHAIVAKRTAEMQELANKSLAQATSLEQQNKGLNALDAIEHAASVWPASPEISAAHRRIASQHQRLRVGVEHLAGPPAHPLLQTAAHRRHLSLTEVRLFQPRAVDERIVRFEAPTCEQWEPAELGRSLRFQFRLQRPHWNSQPTLTAGTVATALEQRLDPRSPLYDDRLAHSIDSYAVRSPFELVVQLKQVPLRPEALFTVPLFSQPRSPGQAAGSNGPAPVTYPFQLMHRDDRQVIYRRAVPEPDNTLDRHVLEIVEQVYTTHEKAIQGLMRGEVSLLPEVYPWEVKEFETRKDLQAEFNLLPYSLPTTHLLQFNPRSKALSNRLLRKALALASQRELLLEEIFLHESPGRFGKLTSAPFPSTSYAYNPTVAPHKFDPTLAFSLAVAAKKELGGQFPELTMVIPRDVRIQQAAEKLVTQWGWLGVKVHLKVDNGSWLAQQESSPNNNPSPRSASAQARTSASKASPAAQAATAGLMSVDSTPPAWDIVYRTVSMSEPLVELWPFLTLSQTTDMAAINHLPLWMRHELVRLDQSGDFPSAEASLRRLHKELAAGVYLLPLWELQEFAVARRTIRNIQPTPIITYQYAERWKLDPYFPRDPVEKKPVDMKLIKPMPK